MCLRLFLVARFLSLVYNVMLSVLFGALLFGVCVVACACSCVCLFLCWGKCVPPRVRHDVVLLLLFFFLVMLLCSSAWGMLSVCCVLYVFVWCVYCVWFAV